MNNIPSGIAGPTRCFPFSTTSLVKEGCGREGQRMKKKLTANLGLKIRAVGESEKAAASVGINVIGIKILAFALTGAICSLGGAYMSMGYLSWFSASMIAGRGFIGMSAMNLSNARPFRTMFIAIMFAGVDALAMTLQTLNLPAEPLQMLPYLITIIALIVFAKHDMKQEEKKKKELAMAKE